MQRNFLKVNLLCICNISWNVFSIISHLRSLVYNTMDGGNSSSWPFRARQLELNKLHLLILPAYTVARCVVMQCEMRHKEWTKLQEGGGGGGGKDFFSFAFCSVIQCSLDRLLCSSETEREKMRWNFCLARSSPREIQAMTTMCLNSLHVKLGSILHTNEESSVQKSILGHLTRYLAKSLCLQKFFWGIEQKEIV